MRKILIGGDGEGVDIQRSWKNLEKQYNASRMDSTRYSKQYAEDMSKSTYQSKSVVPRP